ncbi:MAG TPA: hypothetical protein VMU39_21805 [Solirubrobacteraceae bacterium]|nr:hypothetical protein [Solirubrobacteraceae bacterium]
MTSKRQDSLLAHCIARAIIAEVGGEEAAREKWGDDAAGVAAKGRWAKMRLTTKVTPKASRVAAFVVLWAWAMKDEKRDSFTITEFRRYYATNERHAYRDQADFRELWPEYETPDELARQVMPHLQTRKDAFTMHMTVPVTA